MKLLKLTWKCWAAIAVIQEVLPKKANSRKGAKNQCNVLPVKAVSITPTSEPETVMSHKYHEFPILLFCGTVQMDSIAGKVYGLLQGSALMGQIPSSCTSADRVTHCWDTICRNNADKTLLELTHVLFWDLSTVHREIILSVLKQQARTVILKTFSWCEVLMHRFVTCQVLKNSLH